MGCVGYSTWLHPGCGACYPVLWMRVDNNSLLSSILAFSLKRIQNSIQFIEFYFGFSEQIKSLQPIGQAAEFKVESKLNPCRPVLVI